MGTKVDGFLKHLEEEYKNGSIYVWGAQGQVASENFIKKCESGNDEKRALRLYKKRCDAGYVPEKIKCFDCSGLGMCYIQNETKLSKSDKNANGMMGNCTIIQKKHVKPGDMCFQIYKTGAKKGRAYHVGYIASAYADGGTFYESKGRDHGVIKSSLKKEPNRWHVYGRPKWFADEIDSVEERTEHAAFNRVLVKGHKGDDVRELQKLLKKAGYKLDADGSFGALTKEIVKDAQLDERFSKKYQDGKAGEMTITVLGGKWEGTVTKFDATLSKGCKGDKVAMLQVLLRKAGYNIAVDGSFGVKTLEAVKEYQEKKKLTATGKADKNVITKLGGTWK